MHWQGFIVAFMAGGITSVVLSVLKGRCRRRKP